MLYELVNTEQKRNHTYIVNINEKVSEIKLKLAPNTYARLGMNFYGLKKSELQ